MFLPFGRFAHERCLVRCLRGRFPKWSWLEALMDTLTTHERREALLWDLLCKTHAQANKALARLGQDDTLYSLLRKICSGAFWEVQSMELRGGLMEL